MQISSVQTFDSLQCGVSVAEKDTISLTFIISIIKQHFPTGKKYFADTMCKFFRVFYHISNVFSFLIVFLALIIFLVWFYASIFHIKTYFFFQKTVNRRKGWKTSYYKTWTYFCPVFFFSWCLCLQKKKNH